MTSMKKSVNTENAVSAVVGPPPAIGVSTPILASQTPPPAPVHTVHGERPEKFNGTAFKRWQQKMLFYLTTLNLGKFLKEIAPVKQLGETDRTTVAAIDSWHHSDFLCKNYILNGLDNTLYNVYSPFKTAKALWESLKKKYKTEDAGLKKFVVGRFLDFKMNDGQTVMSQVLSLQLLMHEIEAEGMSINKAFQVAAVIEKLPPSWKDFKSYLKHKRKDMSLEDLIVRLRIEEDNRGSEKQVTRSMDGKVNMVEQNPKSKKRKNYDDNNQPKEENEKTEKKSKFPGKCFNCQRGRISPITFSVFAYL